MKMNLKGRINKNLVDEMNFKRVDTKEANEVDTKELNLIRFDEFDESDDNIFWCRSRIFEKIGEILFYCVL